MKETIKSLKKTSELIDELARVGTSKDLNNAIARIGAAMSPPEQRFMVELNLTADESIQMNRFIKMLNAKPILFSTEMVQAITANRKTQTRRVVKPQPVEGPNGLSFDWPGVHLSNGYLLFHGRSTPWTDCPYGQRGDILWVREAFYAYGKWIKNGVSNSGKQKWKFVDMTIERHQKYMYVADPEQPNKVLKGTLAKEDGIVGYWKRPSLFMPRSACRLFLELTEFRVERLHDISETDSIAEGVYVYVNDDQPPTRYRNYLSEHHDDSVLTKATVSFLTLWMSINGTDSWYCNPLVWVIEFKKIEYPL